MATEQADKRQSPPRSARESLLIVHDKLTREEFEWRYQASPEIHKAELVEGLVYMPSPARSEEHGRPQLKIVGWLAQYEAMTPGVIGDDNATLRLDLDNEFQPDAMLRISPQCGGSAALDDDGYISGSPELVVEVSASTRSYDLHAKLPVYRRNGVQEYIVWRVLDGAIDWFVLDGSVYQPLAADAAGVLKSRAFPGLWLDVQAMLADNLAGALATLQAGLASPEHAAFVAQLNSKRKP